MATNLPELERRLWAAADELRANSNLTATQYRDPVLALIFLAYQARGVLYVADEARLSTIAKAPEAPIRAGRSTSP